MACLKHNGNAPSESERFTMLVMGRSKESRHSLRRKVGMTSSVQEELDDCIMADRTSSVVAGGNSDRVGGAGSGTGSGVVVEVGVKEAVSLAILPLKKSRNEVANAEVEEDDGRMLGGARERRESRHAQSFLGWFVQPEINDLKWARRAVVISFAT